ncbi:MAG: deoxynucleoside kinase [Sedimentisphaerales bacterium]|nr:deoxynucleoside kinase [Sedimentisphaerales bacterium]
MQTTSLISVAGIIGVGKTTLAQNLAQILSAQLILEEYDMNPFLDSEFAGNHDAALPSELFFLLSRARQLHKKQFTNSPSKHSAGSPAVTDYIFQKNRIFARMYLNDHQFAIYNEVEKSVASQIAPPSVVIFLHDTVENCLARIAARGRSFEKSITADWLKNLSDQYHNLFRNFNSCPVITLDVSQNDPRKETVIHQIADRISNETIKQ